MVSSLTVAGPYPTFSGHGPPPPKPSASTGSSALPPLTPNDRTKFTRIFVGCGPQNGLISGDKARDVFVKSQLGYDKLGQIWYVGPITTRPRPDQQELGGHSAERLSRSPRLHHRHVPHSSVHGKPGSVPPSHAPSRRLSASVWWTTSGHQPSDSPTHGFIHRTSPHR